MEQYIAASARTRRAPWIGAAVAACLVALHLLWELFHGGVVSHHLLAREHLPAISNAWGLLLVPALAWWTLRQVLRRSSAASEGQQTADNLRKALFAFVAALLYGGALAGSFSAGLGWEEYLFPVLFLIGLVLPVYRGEYLLGFVLGMMLTFGGVLPALIFAVVAAVSWLARQLLRAVVRGFNRGRQD